MIQLLDADPCGPGKMFAHRQPKSGYRLDCIDDEPQARQRARSSELAPVVQGLPQSEAELRAPSSVARRRERGLEFWEGRVLSNVGMRKRSNDWRNARCVWCYCRGAQAILG